MLKLAFALRNVLMWMHVTTRRGDNLLLLRACKHLATEHHDLVLPLHLRSLPHPSHSLKTTLAGESAVAV